MTRPIVVSSSEPLWLGAHPNSHASAPSSCIPEHAPGLDRPGNESSIYTYISGNAQPSLPVYVVPQRNVCTGIVAAFVNNPQAGGRDKRTLSVHRLQLCSTGSNFRMYGPKCDGALLLLRCAEDAAPNSARRLSHVALRRLPDLTVHRTHKSMQYFHWIQFRFMPHLFRQNALQVPDAVRRFVVSNRCRHDPRNACHRAGARERPRRSNTYERKNPSSHSRLSTGIWSELSVPIHPTTELGSSHARYPDCTKRKRSHQRGRICLECWTFVA